ncbi:MAG: sugar ABC transporter permease [Anaerolineae bacterium]|uniref:sugar ABC transporter permease n=1 Tax=Candidatus Amarolinea dominans TaxID=3140696 RepID=UPI001DA1FEA3|nr:sugar ABC transporter permease [Anaerolineae bacterium]MBK7202274.1 sugar ABC transporter permease [Anaerolineae bacterium]MBK9094468.1 sugar ABC transporter permease [Anaerolineae bacterium]MBK9233252.1 sugar ABC transporter permease [Anaerolineae bacterium]
MFLQNLQKTLKQNIREYGMYIALFLIMAIFAVTTKGTFVSSRNLSNLLNQTGYIAVLAVGMTLVIVIRHIDLSVGFLAGFLGAIAAIALVSWKLPVIAVIPLVLALGIVGGLITAYPVAKLGIPSFVASLAGWLIYRGLLLLVTQSTGTIIVPDKAFNAIGNGFIPDIPGLTNVLPGMHKLTLLLGVVGVVFYVISSLNDRKKKQAYNFEVLPPDIFVLQMVSISALLAGVVWVLANYNGISWTVVVMLLVVAIYHFVTTQTVLGRHIYAVGGNPEAAELSGISVQRITYIVFGSMGLMSALSGILFTSRLQSATTTAGTLFELDAIAAAYVGGVSAAGGVGKVIGSIVGALVMLSLTSGMNLMGIGIAPQYIVRGLVLVAAVIFDVTTRNRG